MTDQPIEETSVDEVIVDATASACPITEYRQTDAALAVLSERYAGKLYEVTTPAGMKEAAQARRTLRTYRTELEKARKALKEPILEQGRVIDAEAKRITAALEALENPIDAQIEAEEERRKAEKAAKAEAERERIRVQMNKVAALQNAWVNWAYRPSAEIAAEGMRINTMPLEFDEDFMASAEEARAQTCEQFVRMVTEAKAREDAEAATKAAREAEQAELERQRTEIAEAKRKADEAAAEARAKAEAEAAELARQKAAQEAELAALRKQADEARAEADRAAQAERDRLAAEQREQEAARRAELEAEQKRLDAIRAEQEARDRAERDAREVFERAERDRIEAEANAKRAAALALIQPEALIDLLTRVQPWIGDTGDELANEVHATILALRGDA